jgi:hypothetical protein
VFWKLLKNTACFLLFWIRNSIDSETLVGFSICYWIHGRIEEYSKIFMIDRIDCISILLKLIENLLKRFMKEIKQGKSDDWTSIKIYDWTELSFEYFREIHENKRLFALKMTPLTEI